MVVVTLSHLGERFAFCVGRVGMSGVYDLDLILIDGHCGDIDGAWVARTALNLSGRMRLVSRRRVLVVLPGPKPMPRTSSGSGEERFGTTQARR